MNIRQLILVILNLTLVSQIKATEQVPDYLIYENDTVSIYSNPLDYNIEALFRDTSFYLNTCMSTACWRRYQATWKIENEKLYLIKIEDCCDAKITANMKLIFQDKLIDNKVLADWYSGKLIIPIGNKIYGDHMGYSNVHKIEDIIQIKNGKIAYKKRVDNSKTDLPYFNNEKLIIHLIKNLDKKILQEIWDKKFKLDFYVDIKGNEKREIIKVEFQNVRAIKYEAEIREAINKIKDWNILYRHGEMADLPWIYPIKINKKKLRKMKKYWR